MEIITGNLFTNSEEPQPEEQFESIIEKQSICIERIVSSGHSSPPGFWYDQDRDEFVVLISGSATLRFETPETITPLTIGDYVFIPAHTRHRVDSTSHEINTVWLAIHF